MKKIVTVLLLGILVNIGYSQNIKYENLVFEGAGIRGIAYSGVLSELEKIILLSTLLELGELPQGQLQR